MLPIFVEVYVRIYRHAYREADRILRSELGDVDRGSRDNVELVRSYEFRIEIAHKKLYRLFEHVHLADFFEREISRYESFAKTGKLHFSGDCLQGFAPIRGDSLRRYVSHKLDLAMRNRFLGEAGNQFCKLHWRILANFFGGVHFYALPAPTAGACVPCCACPLSKKYIPPMMRSATIIVMPIVGPHSSGRLVRLSIAASIQGASSAHRVDSPYEPYFSSY